MVLEFGKQKHLFNFIFSVVYATAYTAYTACYTGIKYTGHALLHVALSFKVHKNQI